MATIFGKYLSESPTFKLSKRGKNEQVIIDDIIYAIEDEVMIKLKLFNISTSITATPVSLEIQNGVTVLKIKKGMPISIDSIKSVEIIDNAPTNDNKNTLLNFQITQAA
jgi:hypothetical protein